MAYELELQVADYNARHLTARARAAADMAAYFTEQAVELQGQADYWVTERDRYLGQAGLENVLPITTVVPNGAA